MGDNNNWKWAMLSLAGKTCANSSSTPISAKSQIFIRIKTHFCNMLSYYWLKNGSEELEIYLRKNSFQRDWMFFCKLFNLQVFEWIFSVTNFQVAMILAMWNLEEWEERSAEVLGFIETVKDAISLMLVDGENEFTTDLKLIECIVTGEGFEGYNPLLVVIAMNEVDISEVDTRIHRYIVFEGQKSMQVKKAYLDYLNNDLGLENKIIDYILNVRLAEYSYRIFKPVYEDIKEPKEFYAIWETKYFLWSVAYFENLIYRIKRL